MLFGRKKTTGDIAKEQQPKHRPCWDEKTQASFAEKDRFDVYITSVTKRTGFGKSTTHDIADTRGYEISGLVVYPQWRAELNFDESAGEFGTAWRRCRALEKLCAHVMASTAPPPRPCRRQPCGSRGGVP
ncbi:hypothetical protein ABIF66_010906 [Bradyrhizobium japonicum]